MNALKKRFFEEAIGMQTVILYILISVFVSTVGQLLLKKGMSGMNSVTLGFNQLPSVLWKMVTDPYVFIDLVFYFGATIFWLAALSRVDLSFAYPFTSFSYVIMLVASWIIFDEKITPGRLLGTIIIGIGVLFISR